MARIPSSPHPRTAGRAAPLPAIDPDYQESRKSQPARELRTPGAGEVGAVSQEPTRIGRPPVVATEEQLRLVERGIQQGLTERMVARIVFNVDQRTFRRMRERDPRVLSAFYAGQGELQKGVSRALSAMALRGNVPAIKWLEITRFGVLPREQVEVTGKGGGPIEVEDQTPDVAHLSPIQKVQHLKALLADGRARMKAKKQA